MFLLTGLLILSGAPSLQARESFTLETAIDYGLAHNPSLEISRIEVAQALTQIKENGGYLMPQLNASFSWSRLYSVDSSGPTETDYLDQQYHYASLKLSQTLFAGFRYIDSYKKAKLEKSYKEIQQNLRRQLVIHDIQVNFIRLLQARSELKAASEAVSRVQSSLAASQAYYEKRLLPYVDVLQAEADLEDSEQLRIKARSAIEKARLNLHIVLSLPVAETVTFCGDLAVLPQEWDYTLEQCLAASLVQRPEFAALDKQQAMAVKDERIARSHYYPQVGFDVSYADSKRDYADPGWSGLSYYSRDQANNYLSAGVTLQWKLFDGGSSYQQMKRYQLEQQRLDKYRQETTLEISGQVRTAYLDLEESRQLIVSARKALAVGRENFAREQERLRVGVGILPRLSDAQARLVRFETNLNQALGNFQIARAGLFYMMGFSDPLITTTSCPPHSE